MKKRLLSALCAVMLLVCAVPMASAQSGDDTRMADALTVLHILAGEPDRDLTAPATRAQAAVLLVRLSGGEKHPDTDGWFAGFRDVPEWARTAVNYAARRGWVSGVSNVSFAPNGALNADAWCAMLLRMLGYTEKTGDFEISDAAAFAWRIGVTERQLTGTLNCGDLYESMYDALDFPYKGTETTVLARLIDSGVCTASAANALGLLNREYTARQIADRYLSAGFQMEIYETEEQVHDEVVASNASGFFITADGLAVTNYHSIEDAIKADIVLLNGERYGVERVLYYDTAIDIAVIKVSKTAENTRRTTSAFNHLELVGTADIRPGDSVYAIGNPLGLGLAISSGIIASAAHELERYALPCVVNSADISRGSSGGALLNTHGQNRPHNLRKVPQHRRRGWSAQQLCQLLPHPLRRDFPQQLPAILHSRRRFPLHGEVQHRREPQAPQNSQRILGKALLRLSHTAEHTVFQILPDTDSEASE